MPSPASASAHMMHACEHAERASRHSCIIDMSMPFIGMSDADIAPFIMSIVMFIRTHLPSPGPGVDVAGYQPGDPVALMLRRGHGGEKGVASGITQAKRGGCRGLAPAASAPSFRGSLQRRRLRLG